MIVDIYKNRSGKFVERVDFDAVPMKDDIILIERKKYQIILREFDVVKESPFRHGLLSINVEEIT